MPVKVFDYGSGVDELAKAIPSAIQGYYDSQDRKMRNMEMAAKITADKERKAKEFAEYTLNAQTKGFKAPTSYDVPLERDEGFGLITDPSQRGQFEAKVAELPITEEAKKGLLQKYLYGGGGLINGGIVPLEKTPEQKKIESADVRKRLADAAKAEREAYSPSKELDIDQKKVVETLATKNAGRISSKSSLDAFLQQWPNLSEKQKLAAGQEMIKLLNSTENPDAVGVEEADRLASQLEFAKGNLFNNKPVQFGRDLEGFYNRVKNASDRLGTAIETNQKTIDTTIGRLKKETTKIESSGSKKPWEKY